MKLCLSEGAPLVESVQVKDKEKVLRTLSWTGNLVLTLCGTSLLGKVLTVTR